MFSVDGSTITPDWANITNIPANLDLDSTDDFDGAWGSLTAVPAGFADNVDDDTTYSAGAGLDLTGTVFSVDGSSITPDWTNITNIPAGFADDIDNDTQLTDAQVATAVNNEFPNLDTDATDDFDGAWGSLTAVPAGFADNVDDDTTYTAGAGLDLTGTVFSVDGSTITPDWTNITNIPANLDLDSTDDFDGAWGSLTAVPAGFADNVDDDTTYSAGAGLDLTGTVFSVDGSTITPDWTNITNIPAGFADDIDNDTQLTDAQVATAVNNEFPNLDTDATDDFDGAWGSLTAVPAGFADNVDDDTTYTAGAGLDLTGTVFSVDGSTITPDWTNITNIPANLDLDSTDDFDGAWGSLTAVPAGFADNVDDDTTYSAGAGLDLTGTVFSVDGSSITPDWTNITNIPAGFADDIDNDTQLTDAQVATAVNNEFPNLDTDATDDFDGAWGSLTAVPAGFADNVDDDTTYTAGAGLDLTGTVFSVDGSTITPDWTNITNIPANLDLDSTDDFDGAWGSLTAVPAGFADNVDDDTTYTAGAGLDLTGTVFSVDGSSITPDWTNITNIPAGFADDIDNDTQLTDAQVATAVNNEFPNLDTDATDDFDGAWGSLTAVPAGFADNVDDDTTYTAGAGLDLTGTVFSVNVSSLTGDGTISSSDLTVTGGANAALNNVTLEIAAGAVGTTELADNSVTSAKIVNGTIATADIANDAVSLAKLANGTTSGQMMRWNGSDWVLVQESANEVSNTAIDVDGDGTNETNLQQVVSAIAPITAKAARIFYPPSIAINATALANNQTIDLYQQYLDQFGGTASNFTASAGAPATVPTYARTELYYYVTFADPGVLNIDSINANGVLQYDVVGTPPDYNSLINVVFVVK